MFLKNAIVTTKMTWFPKPKPSLFNNFPRISSWFQGFGKNFSIRNIQVPDIPWWFWAENNLGFIGGLVFSLLFPPYRTPISNGKNNSHSAKSKSWPSLAWGKFRLGPKSPPKIMGNPEFLQFFSEVIPVIPPFFCWFTWYFFTFSSWKITIRPIVGECF